MRDYSVVFWTWCLCVTYCWFGMLLSIYVCADSNFAPCINHNLPCMICFRFGLIEIDQEIDNSRQKPISLSCCWFLGTSRAGRLIRSRSVFDFVFDLIWPISKTKSTTTNRSRFRCRVADLWGRLGLADSDRSRSVLDFVSNLVWP